MTESKAFDDADPPNHSAVDSGGAADPTVDEASEPQPTSDRRRVAVGLGLLVVLLAGVLSYGPTSPLMAQLDGVRSEQGSSFPWFCSAVAPVSGGLFLVNNPTGADASGSVRLSGSEGNEAQTSITVPAGGQVAVVPSDLLTDATVGATFLFSVPGLDVLQSFTSERDQAIPCASRTAPSWTFVEGSTQDGAVLFIGLYNPFTDEAVVDITMATNAGLVGPSTFEGVVVPARGVVMVDIGAEVRRRDWIAPQVDVRRGRITAVMMQGSERGLALRAGVENSASVWDLGAGTAAVSDQIVVFNPNVDESAVTVDRRGSDGNPRASTTVFVPGLGRTLIDLGAEPLVIGPSDDASTIEVHSDGGESLVVARRRSDQAVDPNRISYFAVGTPRP